MMAYRIFYFRGGMLEETQDLSSTDLLAAISLASSSYPHFTAEIWTEGRKIAVVRPCKEHRQTLPNPQA